MQTCPACGTDVSDEEAFCVACGHRLEPEPDPFLGRTVGEKFLVEEIIGEGAMGVVYRARQISLDKPVAVKILHRHLAGERNMARRFHREAKAASRLNHPNSLHIIDFGQTADQTFYIAMELVEGDDLHDVMEAGHPLSLERIVSLLGQVCDALEEAHAARIVHRDLKPENIMVVRRRDGAEEVKVCDFGIAKIQETQDGDTSAPITVAGIVCGTPEFMSPEQARGEKLDGRSDLYSVGVILYQLATGELPFTSDSPLGTVTRHLTERLPLPTMVSPDSEVAAALEPVIMRALAKEADERYQSALELKTDLARVLAGEPVLASPGPALAPAPKAATSSRGRLVAVVGVVAIAVAALAAWAVARLDEGPRSPSDASLAAVARGSSAPDASPETGALDARSEEGGPATAHAEAGVATEGDGGFLATGEGPDRVGEPDLPEPGRRRPRPPSAHRPPPAGDGGVAPPPPPREEPEKADAPGAFELGMRAFRSGDLTSAIREFERARAERPASPSAHRMLGKCYYRVGSLERGRAAYRRYLELRPDAPDRAYIEAIIGN